MSSFIGFYQSAVSSNKTLSSSANPQDIPLEREHAKLADEMHLSLKQWLSLLFPLTLCASGIITEAAECREPDNVDNIRDNLQADIQQRYLREMSLFASPDYLRKASASLLGTQHELNTSFPVNKVFHRRIYGQPSCRRARTVKTGLTDTECPSYVVIEYDSDRWPNVVAKAKCTCERCFRQSATAHAQCGRKCWLGNSCVSCWSENMCKEVNSHMPVIRRACVEGVYRYGIQIESVAVGCTCQQQQILDNVTHK